MANRFTYLSFSAFLLFAFLANFPFLSIFNYFRVISGMPVLYLYLTGIMLFFILYLLVLDLFRVSGD